MQLFTVRLMTRLIGLASMGLLLMSWQTASARELWPVKAGIYSSNEAGRALTAAQKEELVESLRRITGWADVRFLDDGALKLGEVLTGATGSPTARRLLQRAVNAGFVFLIEDHSGSEAVNFGQLDEGTRYERWGTGVCFTIFRLRLDFADFRAIKAGPQVRASFDAGFTLLHELLHGFGYHDTSEPGAVGQCEEIINRIRAELGLPLRDQYLPDVIPVTSHHLILRLRFRHRGNREKPQQHYLFFVKARPFITPPVVAATARTSKPSMPAQRVELGLLH